MKLIMKLSVPLCLMLMPVMTSAQTYMTVHLKDGKTVGFEVSKRPVIVFENGSMTVGTDRFRLVDVAKYTFSDTPLSVLEFEADCRADVFVSRDGKLMFRRGESGSEVCLYTLSGISVPANVGQKDEDWIEVDVSRLSSGHYLLTNGSLSLKFFKP